MNSHPSATHGPRFLPRLTLKGHRLLVISATLVLVLTLAVVGLFALGDRLDKVTTERADGGGTQVVRVDLVDVSLGFDVTPDIITVDPGTHLVLQVVNDGKEAHDLALDGGVRRTHMLDPGESQRLDLGTITSDIGAWCTLSGHKLIGMSLQIHVNQRHRSPA